MSEPTMNDKVKAHMALTDEQRYALVEEHLGLKKHRDDLVIDPRTGRYTDAARYFDLIDAAIALHAEQAEPGFVMVQSPITEEMHIAAVKVLHRAHGVDGLPQRMLDAMVLAGGKL